MAKIKSARPHLRGDVKCIAFVASLALVGLMLAAGIPVRTHPLRGDQYVVPVDALSPSQIFELADRHDFIYLSTVVFYTTGTGVQTATSDATWNNADNSVEIIAGGGSGGAVQQSNGTGCGGGGGEYGKTTNFSFATPGTTTFQYQIGQGGAAIVTAVDVTVATSGNPGTDTWFNGASQAAATLGAIHGNGGQGVLSGSAGTGGAGGTGGVGTTHNAGGQGGSATSARGQTGTGGGGAGGPTGAGNQGVDATGASQGTNGGSGSAGAGGAAGTGTTVSPGGAGGIATQWTSTLGANAGAGGGGGGNRTSTNAATAGGDGGLYGAGGGGCQNTGSGSSNACKVTSGAGGNGILVLTWTPVAGVVGKLFMTNQAIKRASYF